MEWFKKLSERSQDIVIYEQERRQKAVAAFLSHRMSKKKAQQVVRDSTKHIESICRREIRQENLK